MRLNQYDPIPTAADLINQLSQKDLQLLFSKYVQQPYSQEICHEIINHRHRQKIITAKQLSNLIQNFYDRKKIPSHHHPATLIFLALRIAVNNEFSSLTQALTDSCRIAHQNTVITIISFHSGEDRLIKNFIRQHHFSLHHPIKPTFQEIKNNPLSRSAVLRWFYPSK
jgi:16S rRNA (cytosine1402-N4)-methyltransferase